MKSSSLISAAKKTNGIGASLLRRAVLRQLGRLRHGQLVVRDGDERLVFGQAGALLHAEIDVLDSAFWSLVAGSGSIGAGEAYIHGMNGIAEMVRQVRGTAVNQVANVENVLATAGTGVPTSGLILGAE